MALLQGDLFFEEARVKKCHEDCIPACDFCIYFTVEKKWCSYNRKKKEPQDMCEYFYCIIQYVDEMWQ